jgi:hypothetical protein
MNEHFNRVTRKYRYKSKEFKKPEYFPKKMGDSFKGVSKYGGKCTFIKYNYRPYFIYRLFWWLSKPLIYFSSINTNQKIRIIIFIIGSIITISLAVIGWMFFL